MTEEPYRWLEAIENRREYVRDQLKGGTPVIALSRPDGILLFGVGLGQTKVFEIFDRHAMAALGHPVDIEKLRQSAIEAAHMEGFNRSPKDVTLRRLLNFSLSPALKNAFEAIYSPPLMVESIFVELGESFESDMLVRLHFDGHHQIAAQGVVVAHYRAEPEKEATDWLQNHLKKNTSRADAIRLCQLVWQALADDKTVSEVDAEAQPAALDGRKLEVGWLNRKSEVQSRYETV